MTPEFKLYIQQVKKNAAALGVWLQSQGYTGGTDNHLILWDLRPLGLTGSKLQALTDKCHITLNKNCVPGDRRFTVDVFFLVSILFRTFRSHVSFSRLSNSLSPFLQFFSQLSLFHNYCRV